MSESHSALHAQPALRRQRLVRVDEATTLAGRTSSRLAPFPAVAGPALPSPFLEEQTWLAVEASRLLCEAQPVLETERAPKVAPEVLQLVQVLLHLLLGELAAGADARVAAIDGVFATLLNAPGHAGLIEQGLLALSAPATTAAPVQRSADDAAVLEALRRLHRELVALSLGWEALLAGRGHPRRAAPHTLVRTYSPAAGDVNKSHPASLYRRAGTRPRRHPQGGAEEAGEIWITRRIWNGGSGWD